MMEHVVPDPANYPRPIDVLEVACELVGCNVEDALNRRIRRHGASTARQAAMRWYFEKYPGTFIPADLASMFGASQWSADYAMRTETPAVLITVRKMLEQRIE